ncbi:MAG: hypothetical protein COT24_04155 [Candidatus Kerfeldbacteria bacterium CG08_land_8_20_14_0_20_40_16]|uniref:Uncharacterized protein n=1 Tax=Candidatus Kerfeldbacteria bacterium CG08_land_8_20_14_0_20_40_16 TaxID=2014244 RepID=A0A2H0YVK3_9BACT|nr:MAG: hypothetical protein COT24_04155 [Candidatus Kerfeldbacteria bacterium CG08_land_8_20_14_0_20_40_16]
MPTIVNCRLCGGTFSVETGAEILPEHPNPEGKPCLGSTEVGISSLDNQDGNQKDENRTLP